MVTNLSRKCAAVRERLVERDAVNEDVSRRKCALESIKPQVHCDGF